ncbi:hypothetical protein YPPY07_2586, partial [Yersinia pestis PY-07]
MACISCNGSP